MENVPQPEHIRFLFDPTETIAVFAGQRRRFASTVEGLSTEELTPLSRCEGWTVADVLRHLVWVDVTIRRIWAGDQSVAEGFDPRITPREAVQGDRAVSDEEIRDRYLLSTETMLSDLECSDPQRFGQPSLSPAGLVPWWMSVVHIGWDSSIHERDALLPLGRGVAPLDVETNLCLAYSLVLASFFAGGDPLSMRIGTVTLRRDDGPVIVQAQGGEGQLDAPQPLATVVTDDPVTVIDAISGRGSLEESVSGDKALIHRIGGLARYFTSPSV
jgi:uncharacterized protein (TIGR03083 family)